MFCQVPSLPAGCSFGAVGHWSDRDRAMGGGELDRDQARFLILDPGDVDLVEGVVGRFAEEFGDGGGVAGDGDPVDGGGGARVGARALLDGDQPLEEVGQLRVLQQFQQADLLPPQVEPVGADTVALGRGAAEAGLDRGDVVDGDHPTEPAAALGGAARDRLAEGCAVGGGVVECGDDLDLGAAAQRENEITGAEPRVNASVDEPGAEGRSDPLDGRDEAVAGHRIGHVIKSH